MQKRLSQTIASVINELSVKFDAAELYYGHGTENAYDEAAWLVLHVLNKPLNEDCDATELVSEDAFESIMAIANVRIETKKPLAYLLKSSWFCGLEFYIDERALIPRSPIAELLLEQFSPWLSRPDAGQPTKILDMCTGSACIAIASALYIDNSQVDACDISEEALELAKFNVDKYELQDRVHLCKSDIFDGLPSKEYDLIVCNPPYVDALDMSELPAEYEHEPELALASGNDGLDFVRQFLQKAPEYLSNKGGIILEVGNSAEALESAYPKLNKVWLEFERGGEGVCFISTTDLKAL